MTFPEKMVVRRERNGQNLTIACSLCAEHYRAGDPEAVLYEGENGSGGRIGFVCPACYEVLRINPSAIAARVQQYGIDNELNESSFCVEMDPAPCPEGVERESGKRDEELRCERRTHGKRAAWLFANRRLIGKLDKLSSRLANGVANDKTAFLPALIHTIEQDCDETIEGFADEIQGSHPDLADGIRLLLGFFRCGGEAENELGITDDGGDQQWQTIITGNTRKMDAQTWQRLFELRDVVVELLDDTPPGPSETIHGDNIPF